MIKVVNKHWHKSTPDDLYIGRGSPLGNPFTHLDSKFPGVIKVSSREEAIWKYDEWLHKALMNDAVVNASFKHIFYSQLNGKNVNLVCYCSPACCHGDVIKKLVEEELERYHSYNLTKS